MSTAAPASGDRVAPPSRWRWLRWLTPAFGIGLVLLAALEAYVRWPSDLEPDPIALDARTRELVLVVHGSFGAEEPTLLALEQRLNARLHAQGRTDVQVLRYRWSPWSDNILRAGPRAERIGARLGRGLGAAPGLVRLRLVAHSAGAYMLDPLCEAWREARAARGAPPGANVHMTFLDPIGLRGLFDRSWGAQHFGRCASAAEAYVNTDDAAPATNLMLRHARSVDVTRAPGRSAFADGHRWPVQYYLDHLDASTP